MEPRHQPLEAGVPVVAFAAAFGVQDRVPQIEPRNVLDDPGVTLRPIDAGHGVKAHALAASVDLQPDAIVLYDAAFGAASGVTPKFVSPSDPAAQWTGAMRGPAFFAYANNYLIDVKFGVIMDVEASRAIRQAEVGAAKTMIERTEERFDIKPERLAADTAYGSGANLNWLVKDKKIAPHIPVIDKSKREDGTFSRDDFRFDKERNLYTCPAGKTLTTTGRLVNDGETTSVYGQHASLSHLSVQDPMLPKGAFP